MRDPVAGSGLVFGLSCMDFDRMDSDRSCPEEEEERRPVPQRE